MSAPTMNISDSLSNEPLKTCPTSLDKPVVQTSQNVITETSTVPVAQTLQNVVTLETVQPIVQTLENKVTTNPITAAVSTVAETNPDGSATTNPDKSAMVKPSHEVQQQEILKSLDSLPKKDPNLNLSMGNLYRMGVKNKNTNDYILKPDDKKSFEFHKLAADSNDQLAHLIMGLHYYEGIGVSKNKKLAHESINKALEAAQTNDAVKKQLAKFTALAIAKSKNDVKSQKFIEEFYDDLKPTLLWL